MESMNQEKIELMGQVSVSDAFSGETENSWRGWRLLRKCRES